ncbi:MAG: class I SAM-dependent methyltransferase [Polyangiaceae bacterium]|nr:class I SAM-dependent methyltransferase [Polyangiaceae bacterium]
MATKEFFVTAYEGTPPPWDLGRPQRDLVQLFAELNVSGSAVDLGCGTGENVLELAQRGVEAWGVDSTPYAIAEAEKKRDRRGLKAHFVCGDALDLKALGRPFDMVLDCGLFHVIAEEERLRYVQELSNVLLPGGRFVMLGFQTNTTRERGPRGYSAEELRTYLASFREELLRPATYETNDSAGVPAWLSVFQRVA